MEYKIIFAIWNKGCEFYFMMNFRIYSSFLLCCDSHNDVKLMFLIDKVLYGYGHDLLNESPLLGMSGEWKSVI